MREIKFRVWEGEKMIHLTAGYGMEYISINGFEMRSEFESVILMQYTGLKDKNGKEIYEGDIVKAEEYVGFKNLTAEVIYNRGRFCLNTGTIPEDLLPELSEIIGNIYENPELLK